METYTNISFEVLKFFQCFAIHHSLTAGQLKLYKITK